ncbi:MAG: metal ABC transporter substrate-binding protein [Treponema sp.]|nr:metal ABC transporter substrate-binding protein [Treponema sp.]
MKKLSLLAKSLKSSFRNTVLAAAAFLFLTAGFFGCKKDKAEGTQITATFYPLYIMLLNITEGAQGVQVNLLSSPDTGCLHDYQLTTKDMQLIEKSDILVANGSGMESFLEKVLETKKDTTILASEGFELLKENDDNPHIWVSLQGAVYETNKIAAGLASLDEKNAELYLKNAELYAEKLNDLGSSMKEELLPYKNSSIITFHEAFPYFASEFSLNLKDVIEREPGTPANAAELASMIKLINQAKMSGEKIALYAEPQYSSAEAEIISKETGLTVYQLDPCVTGLLEKDAYLNAMKQNLETLKLSLGK